jgi:hypothetical protein
MTAKEAARLSGRSITWMRTHCCAWCDQSMLNAVRYGCGAMGDKCNPRERAKGERGGRTNK